MSPYAAEHLYGELKRIPEITAKRRAAWNKHSAMVTAKERCTKMGNGHLFWFYAEDKWNYIKGVNGASSHYDALHLTVPGRRYGRAGGFITNATRAMKMLVKLSTDEQTTSAASGRIQKVA
jgi:hypothetical protein